MRRQRLVIGSPQKGHVITIVREVTECPFKHVYVSERPTEGGTYEGGTYEEGPGEKLGLEMLGEWPSANDITNRKATMITRMKSMTIQKSSPGPKS